MIEKDIVIKNFSKNSVQYDKYAVVQKYMAEKLHNLMRKDIDYSLENMEILEIGCGTGILSNAAYDLFSKSNLLLSDISPEMLKRTMEKMEQYKNIRYKRLDGEEPDIDQTFDLIISSAVFQWYNNLGNAFRNYGKILNDNGRVYFATFIKDTYKELKEVFREIGVWDYTQNFLSVNEIIDSVGNEYKILFFQEERKIETYDKLIDFLRAIKGIGASSGMKNKRVFTGGMLRNASEIYDKKYRDSNGISVTNHILYMGLEKK